MTLVKSNQRQHNGNLPQYNEAIAEWHHDRNLIEGATSSQQFPKLLEEMLELYAALNPDMSPEMLRFTFIGMINKLYKTDRIVQGNPNNVADSIGDIDVVLIGIAERENIPKEFALRTAYNEIKNRKGKMINGVFVKEGDLNE